MICPNPSFLEHKFGIKEVNGKLKPATGKAWGPQTHFEREKASLVWACGTVRTTVCDIHIDGKRRAGRPKLTWKTLTDCCEWKLTTVDPQERSTWRSGVRFAMPAASQLPGRGPTDVDDLHLYVNQKFDYDMMMNCNIAQIPLSWIWTRDNFPRLVQMIASVHEAGQQ